MITINNKKLQQLQLIKKQPIDKPDKMIIVPKDNLHQKVQQNYYAQVALIINYLKQKEERKIDNINNNNKDKDTIIKLINLMYSKI